MVQEEDTEAGTAQAGTLPADMALGTAHRVAADHLADTPRM